MTWKEPLHTANLASAPANAAIIKVGFILLQQCGKSRVDKVAGEPYCVGVNKQSYKVREKIDSAGFYELTSTKRLWMKRIEADNS